MAPETKSTAVKVKVKSSAQDGSSKGKTDSSAIKKKTDSSSKHPPDSKMKSVTVTKSEVSIFKFGVYLFRRFIWCTFRPIIGVI